MDQNLDQAQTSTGAAGVWLLLICMTMLGVALTRKKVKQKTAEYGSFQNWMQAVFHRPVAVTAGVTSPVTAPPASVTVENAVTEVPAADAGALALRNDPRGHNIERSRTFMQQQPTLSEKEQRKLKIDRFVSSMLDQGVPNWYLGLLLNFYHILTVGPTGSGKSVFVRGMMTVLSNYGKVIVLDPHIKYHWEGVEVIGSNLNFNALSYAMNWLYEEMIRRFEQANKDRNYEPEHLYIIVDEFPAIVNGCGEEASNFIVNMAQQARKVHMHIIVITQSSRVKSLGIEGKGDVRENFVVIYLGSEAVAQRPDYFKEHEVAWPCVIGLNRDNLVAPRDFVLRLSKMPINPESRFVIPNLPERNEGIRSKKLLAERVEIAELDDFGMPDHATLAGVAAEIAREEESLSQAKYEPAKDVSRCMRAIKIVKDHPEYSVRKVAEQLYESGNGRYSVWTKAILRYVYEETGITLDSLREEWQNNKPPF